MNTMKRLVIACLIVFTSFSFAQDQQSEAVPKTIATAEVKAESAVPTAEENSSEVVDAEESKPAFLFNGGVPKSIDDLKERTKVLFNGKDKAGEFYRKSFIGLFQYEKIVCKCMRLIN